MGNHPVMFEGKTFQISEKNFPEWDNGYMLVKVVINEVPKWFCRCFMCGTIFTLPYDGEGEEAKGWGWFDNKIHCPLCQWPEREDLRLKLIALAGRAGVKAW